MNARATKLLIFGLLALCAAVPTASDEAASDSAVAEQEGGLVPLSALPTGDDDLETAKRALESLGKFVEMFAIGNGTGFGKLLEKTGIAEIAEVIGKVMSFIVSIINLVQGINSESSEMKFLREQFAEVHAKLDGINLQLNDVKNLIEWRTTRLMYAKYETFIISTCSLLSSYVKAPEHEREIRKRQFVDVFKNNRLAALKLYQAVVEKDFVVSENLGAAVVHYTQNHRQQSTAFLQELFRTVLRGAQLEIAYEKMEHGEAAGKLTEADWKIRLEKMLTKIKDVQAQVKNAWNNQMQRDVSRILLEQRGLSNQHFCGHMYNFLVNKFDWFYWISLAYNEVGGFDNHAITYCGGVHHFRTYGRNMMVASSNPDSSRFTQANGNRLLAEAESAGHRTTHAGTWVDEINRRVGNYCDDAAFRGAICWGCNVWWTVRSDRYAYRKMTVGGSVNTILFG